MEQSNCLPCRGKIAICVSAALGLLGSVLAWYYGFYPIYILRTISAQLKPLVALPWIIYVLFFYQKRKRAVLPAILFFCIAFFEVIPFFSFWGIRSLHWFDELLVFKSFCFFVLYLLVAIDVLRGIRWRVFDLVVFSLSLLWIVVSAAFWFGTIFLWPASSDFFEIFLYVSFLIFFAANRVRPVIRAGKKATIAQMSPEKALTLLQEERDQNWISEEEFQQRRREVLEKLM